MELQRYCTIITILQTPTHQQIYNDWPCTSKGKFDQQKSEMVRNKIGDRETRIPGRILTVKGALPYIIEKKNRKQHANDARG